MVNNGVQHYFPASLIGQFSPEVGKGRRGRRVFVANKHDEVKFKAASALGYLKDFPYLYDDPADPVLGLDDVWGLIEKRIRFLDEALRLPEHRVVPAWEFLTTWVPYAAHLIARAPRIGMGLGEDLRTALSGATSWADREHLLGRLMDVFAAVCTWTVIETTTVSFLTSDAGFLFLPSLTGGALLIPLSPCHALFIEHGRPTLGGAKVRIARRQWSAADVQLVNDALSVSAGREVYAHVREQADRASDIMGGRLQPDCDSRGVVPGDLRFMAIQGATISFPTLTKDRAGQAYHSLCTLYGVHNNKLGVETPDANGVIRRLRTQIELRPPEPLQTCTVGKKFMVANSEGLLVSGVPFGKPAYLVSPPGLNHLTTSGE